MKSSVKIVLLNNTYAKIVTESGMLYRWIRDYLSVYDEESRFTVRYKRGYWNGNVEFLNSKGEFLIGLFPKLYLNIVKYCNVIPEVEDLRIRPDVGKLIVPGKIGNMELRDYQWEIADRVLNFEVGGVYFPRGIVYAATNAGKSLIGAAIFKSLGKIPVLYLCHRQELLKQIYDWYLSYMGEPVGMYDTKHDDIQRITVAMITTMYSRRKSEFVKRMLRYFKCIIVDEAHRASANSWFEVISKSCAYYKIAFSGTALKQVKHRNVKLAGMTGPVLGRITNKELVKLGYSALPIIGFVEYPQSNLSKVPDIADLESSVGRLSGVIRQMELDGASKCDIELLENKLREMRRKLYFEIYYRGIVCSKQRLNGIVKLIKKYRGFTIIIVNKISHGRKISDELYIKHNIKNIFIHGNDSMKDREKAKIYFESGIVKVLIATMIYKEGIDIPIIDTLIIACGEQSPITILQIFGRGLRKSGDKKYISVYDFYDKSHKKLLAHTKNRIEIYKEDGWDINKVIL